VSAITFAFNPHDVIPSFIKKLLLALERNAYIQSQFEVRSFKCVSSGR